MKIRWNPSPELIKNTIKPINDLKKQGKTYDQIQKIIKKDYTLIVNYNKWYEAHFT